MSPLEKKGKSVNLFPANPKVSLSKMSTEDTLSTSLRLENKLFKEKIDKLQKEI